MKNTCSNDECKKDVFEHRDECVLHCEKERYSEDRYKGVLSSFYDALVDYVVELALKSRPEAVNPEILKENLIQGNGSDEVINFCATSELAFTEIFFPGHDERDSYNYLNLLKKLKGAWFIRCKFTAGSIDTPNLEVFFDECEFWLYWSITPLKVLDNVNNVLFQNCKFLKGVSLSKGDERSKHQFDVQLFENCIFEQELSFRDVKLKSRVFNNTNTDFLKIDKLIIENCEIDEKFILNKLKINSLLIKNSTFNSKVEFKGNEIDEIKIIDTNFNSLFDSFDTKYEKFYCFKSIYSDFVGFEDCKFLALATFKYVTFLSFTNFRNATFNQGLDLQTTNLKEAPNFLNIDVLSNNTNRETFRIIKDSFDKIGNHIEANKFFGREMCKYEEELPKKLFNQEKIIFKLNKLISNFGQSYIRPIILIIICTVLYSILVLGHEKNWLYTALPVEANNTIGFIADILNGGASNIIPFKNILKEGMEFVSLIFYIIFASLIWQTIVAVKRHTRR